MTVGKHNGTIKLIMFKLLLGHPADTKGYLQRGKLLSENEEKGLHIWLIQKSPFS